MPKKIQLTIPKPCHEDWDAMTPVEKGKFCGSCQKQVVDFSSMSDRQVAEFFRKPSTGSVCGRFMTDQLDREIEIPRKRIPWIKYFFTIALPAFVVSVKATASRAQGKIKVNEVSADTTRPRIYDDVRKMGMVSRPQSIRPFVGDTIVNPVTEPVKVKTDPVCMEPVMGKPSFDFIAGEVAPGITQAKGIIRGKVVNEQGEPVPFSTIEINKREAMISDEKGDFIITRKQAGKKGEIIISSAGYENKTIVLDKENYRSGELIAVLKSNVVLREVVLKSYGAIVCNSVAGQVSIRMGGVLAAMKIRDNTESHLNMGNISSVKSFHLFPNPVSSGTDLTIEWKQTAEGYYQLQLINQAGQPVYQKEIWIDADARLLNLDIPVTPAGTYFLVLVNKKTGKKFSEKVMVQ